jgi:hypothetical protein
MAFRTKATVYQSQIEQDFWIGSIYRNVRDTGELHLELAQAIAPVRTGHLRDSMDVVLTPHGKLQWRYTIRVNADYAEYTLRPTGPLIYPRKSLFLWVPKWKGSRLRVHRMFVKGYFSRNWLEESTSATFIAENLI